MLHGLKLISKLPIAFNVVIRIPWHSHRFIRCQKNLHAFRIPIVSGFRIPCAKLWISYSIPQAKISRTYFMYLAWDDLMSHLSPTKKRML